MQQWENLGVTWLFTPRYATQPYNKNIKLEVDGKLVGNASTWMHVHIITFSMTMP